MSGTINLPATRKQQQRDDDAFVRIERVETKKHKILLHPMKIDFPEGSITAILGPSGSGKTTLMNTLTDNIQSNVTAVAQVNLPGEAAFVPQDDRLHGFYTCRTYLKHYARLTGHYGITDEMNGEISTLLTALGLQDQQDTIVGDIFLKGLSGGQKRRLSVALEALTRPQNFFLDEPTSGLDAESAMQLMLFLQSYARASHGRHVILTIHQPSSLIWELIDNVVLLSRGKLMYQGPRRRCIERFFDWAGHPTPPNYNPADHYVTIVNDEFRNHVMEVDQWADKFAEFDAVVQPHRDSVCFDESIGSLEETMTTGRNRIIETRRSRSVVKVVLELTYRYFLNLWFNPGILGTRVAMYCMLALGVGALFWDLGNRFDYSSIQTRAAVLFYCVAFFIFMSVAVLPFTVMERAIVDKEVRNGYYNPILYQVAQAISSIPGAALLAFLTTLIIITMTKLNEPLWYFLTMFLSLISAEALAQMVSHVVPHFVIGMALIAGMYGFFMLFMGFMLIPSEFPNWLKWTYYVPFHTYGWRIFMYSEFHGIEKFTGNLQFRSGMDVLEYFEIEDVNRTDDIVVLIFYGLLIHIISCVVVYLRYTVFKGTLTPPSPEIQSSHQSAKRPQQQVVEAPVEVSHDTITVDDAGETIFVDDAQETIFMVEKLSTHRADSEMTA